MLSCAASTKPCNCASRYCTSCTSCLQRERHHRFNGEAWPDQQQKILQITNSTRTSYPQRGPQAIVVFVNTAMYITRTNYPPGGPFAIVMLHDKAFASQPVDNEGWMPQLITSMTWMNSSISSYEWLICLYSKIAINLHHWGVTSISNEA